PTWRAVKTNLEVQVVTGGVAGGSHPADQLPSSHMIAGTDQDRRLMGITRGDALAIPGAVVDAGVVAVPAVPSGPEHLAGCCGVDRRTAGCGEIDAGVQPPHVVDRIEAITEVARQSPIPGHEQPIAR